MKCAYHANGCIWGGGIVDFRNHAELCAHEIQQLQQQQHTPGTSSIQEIEHYSTKFHSTTRGEIDELRIQVGRIGGESDVHALGLFDRSYDHKREDIVMLS